MRKEEQQRLSKDEYYLDIAEHIALRSTCIRRNFGAIIVNQDEIISTGYGGAPRKTINCTSIGFCCRDRMGARKGEHYEWCRAVHAEQNAIIQARRIDMLGASLYLVGLDAKTKERLTNAEPCRICRRLIANAGISSVIIGPSKGKPTKYSVRGWLRNNLWELRRERGRLIPVIPPLSLSDATDLKRQNQLISRYSLRDAVVVQTSSFEHRRITVGRAAARFFISNVKTGNSVALSCGDTVLSMIESLPYQSNLRLCIHQLSVEGDPSTIHQAPSTLVGLLRGKCSPRSKVYGLQLPPLDLTSSSAQLREEFIKSEFLCNLKSKVRRSNYIFMGVGSAGPKSTSFWAVAQAAMAGRFPQLVKRLEIIGEINNQIFDESGNNRTDEIPELSKHLVNILTLNDIKTCQKIIQDTKS